MGGSWPSSLPPGGRRAECVPRKRGFPLFVAQSANFFLHTRIDPKRGSSRPPRHPPPGGWAGCVLRSFLEITTHKWLNLETHFFIFMFGWCLPLPPGPSKILCRRAPMPSPRWAHCRRRSRARRPSASAGPQPCGSSRCVCRWGWVEGLAGGVLQKNARFVFNGGKVHKKKRKMHKNFLKCFCFGKCIFLCKLYLLILFSAGGSSQLGHLGRMVGEKRV